MSFGSNNQDTRDLCKSRFGAPAWVMGNEWDVTAELDGPAMRYGCRAEARAVAGRGLAREGALCSSVEDGQVEWLWVEMLTERSQSGEKAHSLGCSCSGMVGWPWSSSGEPGG